MLPKLIKFRAWNSLDSRPECRMLYQPNFSAEFAVIMPDGNEWDLPVMQFSGLLDKKGGFIWEGDILHYKARGFEFNGEVIFNDGGYALKHNGNTYELCQGAIQSCDILDVIGNVYENPDLLK